MPGRPGIPGRRGKRVRIRITACEGSSIPVSCGLIVVLLSVHHHHHRRHHHHHHRRHHHHHHQHHHQQHHLFALFQCRFTATLVLTRRPRETTRLTRVVDLYNGDWVYLKLA